MQCQIHFPFLHLAPNISGGCEGFCNVRFGRCNLDSWITVPRVKLRLQIVVARRGDLVGVHGVGFG